MVKNIWSASKVLRKIVSIPILILFYLVVGKAVIDIFDSELYLFKEYKSYSSDELDKFIKDNENSLSEFDETDKLMVDDLLKANLHNNSQKKCFRMAFTVDDCEEFETKKVSKVIVGLKYLCDASYFPISIQNTDKNYTFLTT